LAQVGGHVVIYLEGISTSQGIGEKGGNGWG
jgi:hypothetical protein